MSATIGQLRAMAESELIERHDRLAGNTVVGTGYYLEELRRRDAARAERKIVLLTWVIAVATVVNLIGFYLVSRQ